MSTSCVPKNALSRPGVPVNASRTATHSANSVVTYSDKMRKFVKFCFLSSVLISSRLSPKCSRRSPRWLFDVALRGCARAEAG